MDKKIFSTGDILLYSENEKQYRVIYLSDTITVLCEMNISKLNLIIIDTSIMLQLLISKRITVDEEEPVLFDIDLLSESIRNKYLVRKQMMNEIVRVYGPTFLDLCGKKPKPEVERIQKKYSYSKTSFWRTCTQYLQSGMKDYSLVDARAFGSNKGKKYSYAKKPGKKSAYFEESGVMPTEQLESIFEDGLKEYRSGRQKTLKLAYDYINTRYFTKTEILNGVPTVVLMPESQRPTWWQFYYYVSKRLTKEEKDIIKTSVREQRNDKRLIISDANNGILGPGDMVEIDACEADVSLVSTVDPSKTVGRPIVYFMIDVYTRIILAVSVAFDNNSILGVTNLFLNLADDKQEYCARYGMGFDNKEIWPSNIIPRRIRVDRGAEFKSKEFGRICNELGIERQLVPGATGSLKGIVEQSFHQMHSAQNVHLENKGLIEKRYDSNHHKEAMLDIEQYTKMIISFVLMHNQKYQDNYPLTKEMIDQNINPIPAILWQYGVKKYGQPRPIPVREQYLYNLMTPIPAKLSRRGISYKELWYLPVDDPNLSQEMFNAATKKVPFQCRIDMRDISNVYYLRDGELITASLNPALTGNADYSGLTMTQWEDYLAKKRQMKAKGKIYNEELSAFTFAVNSAVVDETKKDTLSDSKNMRQTRKIDKQKKSSSNRIASRLEEKSQIGEQDIEKEQKKKSKSAPSSWEEAMDALEEDLF